MYKVVGQNRAAVKLCLDAGTKATINSQILAVESEKLRIRNSNLEGPIDLTISTGQNPLVFDPTNWIVKRQFIAASVANQHILSAQGGIYRVDIPQGDRFILTPSQLVAYQGPKPVNVYEQGRLDIAQAWGSWIRDGLRNVYLSCARATTFLFRKGGELLKVTGPLEPANETPSWHSKDPAYTIYWHKVKTSSFSAWQSLKDWFFYATHPKKLQFEGPCSVLIRGKI